MASTWKRVIFTYAYLLSTTMVHQISRDTPASSACVGSCSQSAQGRQLGGSDRQTELGILEIAYLLLRVFALCFPVCVCRRSRRNLTLYDVVCSFLSFFLHPLPRSFWKRTLADIIGKFNWLPRPTFQCRLQWANKGQFVMRQLEVSPAAVH